MFKELDAIRAILDRLATSEYASAAQATWTPAVTGFSANPAGILARYILVGKKCTCFVRMPNAGTSNATSFTLTAPFTSANVSGMVYYAPILVMDNGVTSAAPGMAMLSANSTTINLYKDWNASAWTASGNKLAQFTLVYETL